MLLGCLALAEGTAMRRKLLRTFFILVWCVACCSWLGATIAGEETGNETESRDDGTGGDVNVDDKILQKNEDSSSVSLQSLHLSIEEIKTEISRCTSSDCIMHWAQLLEEKRKVSTIKEEENAVKKDDQDRDAIKEHEIQGRNLTNESEAIYIKDMVSLDTSTTEEKTVLPQEVDPLVEEVMQEYVKDEENTQIVPPLNLDKKAAAKDAEQGHVERKNEEQVEHQGESEEDRWNDTQAVGRFSKVEEHTNDEKEQGKDDEQSTIVSVAELSVETILKESNIKNDEVHTFPDGQTLTADGMLRPAPAEGNGSTEEADANNKENNDDLKNDSKDNISDDGAEKIDEKIVKDKFNAIEKVLKSNETHGDNKTVAEEAKIESPPPKKELSAREIQARRSADGYLAMALAYSEKQDYELALKQTAKAIKRDKSYPDVYVIQGQLHAATGNVKEAVDDFLLLFQLSPGNTTAVQYLISIAGQVYVYKMHEMVTRCLLPVYEAVNATVDIDDENKNMTRLYHESEISLLLASSLIDQSNYSIALGVLQLNDRLNDLYMGEQIASDKNTTDMDIDRNEVAQANIKKARVNLYITVYEKLNMLDDAESLLQKTIVSGNNTDFTWTHLADFNARQNRSERAIFYYEKVLKELEDEMAQNQQVENSINDEGEIENRRKQGSGIGLSSSDKVMLKLQIASIHKKLGGVYTKVNITRALDHFDKAIDLGLLDAEIRRFYAGAEYRNITSVTNSTSHDLATEMNDYSDDQTKGDSKVREKQPVLSKRQIPRINHRYRWLAAPSVRVISRAMSNIGMKLRDAGASSVGEILKTMPVVP